MRSFAGPAQAGQARPSAIVTPLQLGGSVPASTGWVVTIGPSVNPAAFHTSSRTWSSRPFTLGSRTNAMTRTAPLVSGAASKPYTPVARNWSVGSAAHAEPFQRAPFRVEIELSELNSAAGEPSVVRTSTGCVSVSPVFDTMPAGDHPAAERTE